MVSTAASTQYTSHALSSFFRTTTFRAGDSFVLIDNDGSLGPLPAPYPVEIRKNPAPLSFAANANSLIERALAQGADLYFLNNDVIFTNGWLPPLEADVPAILSPMCNREIQYASSVVVAKTSHVSSVFLCPMTMSLEEYLGNEAALEAIAEAHRKTVGGSLRVYVLPFFCVKIPLVILRALGKFDESFGRGGGEDFDYCLRAYLAGFEVRYAVSSFNLHFGGKSSWSGAETGGEQQEREEKFRNVFREKWGDPLFDLILREDSRILTEAEELLREDQSGNLRSVVESLKGAREITIRL